MNIGFVGLGAMGRLIVRRLLDAGHRVTGWNRSRAKADELIEAGMAWAATPRAVAERSDIVFCART
jgi:3-hydroxyisobutyrate dehydrogenase-like beta-hydroxyacid dehydrogenase